MPEPIQTLLYDINDHRRAEYLKNILQLNTLHAFASIQYDHAPVHKFGVQIAKAQGEVRHFTSAARPNRPGDNKFGNFYTYEGEQAALLRVQHPFLAENLDPQVCTHFGQEKLQKQLVHDLSLCLATHNPFANFYKSMGELMKEEEKKNLNPPQILMRIVNPNEVDPQQLEVRTFSFPLIKEQKKLISNKLQP